MATDTYQAAFAAFSVHNGYDQPAIKFSLADIEHAYYMGMSSGVSQGVDQASYTIKSLSDHNARLAARVLELESIGLMGESDLVKTLLARIATLQTKLGERP